MLFCHCLLLSALYVTAQRQIFAWADGNAAAVAQWRNVSWADVFDGVQADCGMRFVARSPDVVELVVNDTVFDGCRPLLAAVHASGGRFEVWTNGIPPQCLTSQAASASAAASAAQIAVAYNVDGISLDDETDCAPRSTLANFTAWIDVVEHMTATLTAAGGKTLSAAVQAMFGIQNVSYGPLCQPPEFWQCSQACNKLPWEYQPNSEVVRLLQRSMLTWLVMDTYYFSTARFLNALDWYVKAIPSGHPGRLSIAVMNRPDLGPDDYAARFHAINQADVQQLNVFMLPADDAWLPWLKKWKSHCAHCPNGGLLSCFEPSLLC